MNAPDLESICAETCRIAKEAGAFIRTESKKIHAGQVEVKSRNSLVTYVDKHSESLIISQIKPLIPGAGFIAEEGTEKPEDKEYQWVIDPLDGTTNFIHGVPCFSVSIGLLHRGKPVLGVVYEVNLDECFYAWEGSKAYLNGREISVSSAARLEDSLIATGFPYYDYEREEAYMNLFRDLMHSTRGLRRLGSAATDLAYVACGRFEAFYEYSLQPWDVAAGVLIVKQAGGTICDFRGGSDYIFGKELVTTNSNIHPEFMQLVNKHFPR